MNTEQELRLVAEPPDVMANADRAVQFSSLPHTPQAPQGSGTSPGRSCSRCGLAPARKGQWYCRNCHNALMRKYRARQRDEINQLRERNRELNIGNTCTRQHFEERFGGTRTVVILDENVHVPVATGIVLAFLPEDHLRVLETTGKGRVLHIHLDQVEAHNGQVFGCDVTGC